MSWVAVAIGGSAVLGYMGSQNAASAQSSAAKSANLTQQTQFNQTRMDQMPWMNRGNAAGNQLAYLLGLPGYQGGTTGTPPVGQSGGAPIWMDSNGMVLNDPTAIGNAFGKLGAKFVTPMLNRQYAQAGYTQVNPTTGQPAGAAPSAGGVNTGMGGFGSLTTPFSATNWQADPGYAFRLAEGQKALERSGAARGMSLSGAQLKALTAYGQGMGSQEYGAAYGRYNNDQTNLFNRLSAVAGTGQQANQFVGQMGANTANQISQNQLGAGNAAAAGWIGGTNAISNGLNQWANWNTWNSMGGGSGPSSWSYSGMGG